MLEPLASLVRLSVISSLRRRRRRRKSRRRRSRRKKTVYSGANAVNEEDPERDRATQV